MIALLAVPTALVLALAGKGYDLGLSLAGGFGLAILIGVLNGILVAYAEIPSLFATLAVGIGLAGIGQSGLFEYDIVPWPNSQIRSTGSAAANISGFLIRYSPSAPPRCSSAYSCGGPAWASSSMPWATTPARRELPVFPCGR